MIGCLCIRSRCRYVQSQPKLTFTFKIYVEKFTCPRLSQISLSIAERMKTEAGTGCQEATAGTGTTCLITKKMQVEVAAGRSKFTKGPSGISLVN